MHQSLITSIHLIVLHFVMCKLSILYFNLEIHKTKFVKLLRQKFKIKLEITGLPFTKKIKQKKRLLLTWKEKEKEIVITQAFKMEQTCVNKQIFLQSLPTKNCFKA